jgi:hypothetical protein
MMRRMLKDTLKDGESVQPPSVIEKEQAKAGAKLKTEEAATTAPATTAAKQPSPEEIIQSILKSFSEPAPAHANANAGETTPAAVPQ